MNLEGSGQIRIVTPNTWVRRLAWTRTWSYELQNEGSNPSGPTKIPMKKYSATMCVVDDRGGQNGLQYGITQNCIRYGYSFFAHNESEARSICENIGVIYDGQIIMEIECGDDELPPWAR